MKTAAPRDWLLFEQKAAPEHRTPKPPTISGRTARAERRTLPKRPGRESLEAKQSITPRRICKTQTRSKLNRGLICRTSSDTKFAPPLNHINIRLRVISLI